MHAQEDSLFKFILIICLVLGAVISFFIISLVRQHRRNIEMYKAKIAAEITTLENERARISADLHDDLGPLLSAIKFKISSVETNEEDGIVIAQSGKHIDEVINKLRLISNNLLPATLLRKGLVYATEEFIQQAGYTNNLIINFRYGNIPPLPKDIAVNVYRIIQEIIHNSIKHSGAKKLDISLHADENMLLLRCRDSGKGFDQSKVAKDKAGLGLRNLWSRTELLHGEMFLESQLNKGTSYIIEIPLKA